MTCCYGVFLSYRQNFKFLDFILKEIEQGNFHYDENGEIKLTEQGFLNSMELWKNKTAKK